MSYKILRSDQRMAQQEHSCSRCEGPILAGEMYEGTVSVFKGKYDGKRISHVRVQKEHAEMQDCHDWRLDLEIHEAEEASRAREEKSQQAVSLLALIALTNAKTRKI